MFGLDDTKFLKGKDASPNTVLGTKHLLEHRMDGCMDGWMNGGSDEQIYVYTCKTFISMQCMPD